MIFNYLMIGILIIFGGFQYLRINDTSVYSSLKQSYNFESDTKIDGELTIDNPQKHLVIYRKTENTQKTLSNLEEFFKFTKTDYTVKNINEDIGELEKY